MSLAHFKIAMAYMGNRDIYVSIRARLGVSVENTMRGAANTPARG